MLDNEYYDHFLAELKRYVHLEVLLQVVSRDRAQLDHLKMATVYQSLLDTIIDQINNDLAKIRKYFRQVNAKILDIQQDGSERLVFYIYRGHEEKATYIGEFIKVECTQLLKEYIKKSGGLLD